MCVARQGAVGVYVSKGKEGIWTIWLRSLQTSCSKHDIKNIMIHSFPTQRNTKGACKQETASHCKSVHGVGAGVCNMQPACSQQPTKAHKQNNLLLMSTPILSYAVLPTRPVEQGRHVVFSCNAHSVGTHAYVHATTGLLTYLNVEDTVRTRNAG